MKKMKKAGVLVSAIATTAVCASMIAGSTFALFTSEDQVDITVSSGNVSITADVNGSVKTPVSIKETNDGYEIGEYETSTSAGFNATSDGLINVTNVIPGDKVELTVGVENTGSVKAKYNFTLECVEGVSLMNKLVVDVKEDTVAATDGVKKYTSDWAEIDAGAKATYNLTLELPAGLDNTYASLSTKIKTTVFAVQYNADMANPTSNVENFPVVSGVADLTKGGLLVLNSDLALTDTVTFDKDTEIDLNGCKFELNNQITVTNKASVKIANGDINVQTEEVTNPAMSVLAGCSLTLDGVEYSTNGCALYPEGNAAKVVVKNSNLTANNSYCVATNASEQGKNGGVIIELSDSTFSGNSPILLNVPGTINMNNCIVNGNMHGVIVRGGTAVIKDCTISQQNDADTYVNYFDNRNWATGNTVNLAALTVGDKTANSAYDYASEVTLVNTALISESRNPAVYIYGKNNVEGHTCTNDCSTTVNYDASTVAKMNGRVLVEVASNGTPTVLNPDGGTIKTKD